MGVILAVTSGKGGEIILDRASKVINEEFPELAKKCELHRNSG